MIFKKNYTAWLVQIGLVVLLTHSSHNIFAQNNNADRKNRANDKIELNFNATDINTLVQIISKATGVSFLYEDSLVQNKKITLLSEGTYSIEDAYFIFESLLDINGYTTVKEGPYVRIINKNQARSNQSPIVESTDTDLGQGDFITMIIPIKNTDINNIRVAIAPFLSPTTLINQYNPRNLLIVRDGRSLVKKIAELVEVLDGNNANLQVGRYPVQNTDIAQTLNILSDIFLKAYSNKNVFFHIDNKSYSIIVIAPRDIQNQIQRYLTNIDVPAKKEFEFYPLQYISTSEAVELMDYLFPQSSDERQPAPLKLVEENRSGRLLMIGSTDEINRAKDFLATIDVPFTGDSSNYRVFYLKNSDAAEVAQTLQQLTGSLSKLAINQAQTASGSTTATPLVEAPQQGVAPANQPAAREARRSLNNQPNSRSEISIVEDMATNSVVVFASAGELKVIEKLIEDLDIPRPQVFLEVMIMEVSLEKSLQLGIDWRAAGALGSTLIGAGLGGAGALLPTTAASLATQAANSQLGVLGPSLIYNGQSFTSYSAFIKATQRDSDFNLVSNPQILTVSNKEAVIKVGEVRPFQVSSRTDVNNNVTNSYEYKEVGVSLKFTAKIGDDDNISIEVDQATKNIKESSSNSLTPATIERSVVTNILAKDREIVVLGGLISENQNKGINKTFCLGDIPILGALFRNVGGSSNKSNLLIYIKPTIIRTADDRKLLKDDASYYHGRAKNSDVDKVIEDKLNNSADDDILKPMRVDIESAKDVPAALEKTNRQVAPADENSSADDNKKN